MKKEELVIFAPIVGKGDDGFYYAVVPDKWIGPFADFEELAHGMAPHLVVAIERSWFNKWN